MTYIPVHPEDCTTCSAFKDRIAILQERGFSSDLSARWALHEAALGREICYHVFVGVPEWETSGRCASCWRPAWAEESEGLRSRDAYMAHCKQNTDPFNGLPNDGHDQPVRHRNGTVCLDPRTCREDR